MSKHRLLARTKLLGKFVTVQLAVQAMGVASGILLVRALSQTEYAYFTLANSMMATMAILADSGIGIALSSIGGKVWQDRQRFGELINTALRMRRYLAAVAAVAVTPIMIWLLLSNGASKLYAGLVTLIVLIGVNYQLLTGVLMIVPRLRSQITRVQKLDSLVAGSRLVLVSAAFFLFLDAAVAIAASIIGVVLQYLLLSRWVRDGIEPTAPVNSDDRRTMVGIVKHQAPNAVFYCLQGQLTVWLISVFGTTKNIAEVGALGRLGMVFSVISSVMASIVLPSFARCQEPSELRRRYFQVIGGFCLMGLGLVSGAALFPDQLLWILGNKYSNLRSELVLMMALSASSALIAAMWSMNASRAWIKFSWLNIPLTAVIQIVLLRTLPISTLHGVLWFGILSLTPTFSLNVMLSLKGLFGPLRIAPAVSAEEAR
jgi:O-antigen/teichoic acid export membrane protein